MDQAALCAKEEAQGIEGGVAETYVAVGEEVLEQLGAHHEQTAEVEIIAHTAFLIIYDGMRSDHARLLFVAVGIYHGGLRVLRHGEHTFQSAIAEAQLLGLQVEHRKGCLAARGHGAEEFAAGKGVGGQHLAFFGGQVEGVLLTTQHVNMRNDRVVGQGGQRFRKGFARPRREEEIYLLHDFLYNIYKV